MTRVYRHSIRLGSTLSLPTTTACAVAVALLVVAGVAAGIIERQASAPIRSLLVSSSVANSLFPRALPAAENAGHLYVLSDNSPFGGGGRVTVVDLSTRKITASISTGGDVSAVPSRDGMRLYVAAVDPPNDGSADHLFALDLKTGREIWRVALSDRVKYILSGPPTLAVSPDGRTIFVFSYPASNLSRYPQASQVPYWLQMVDASDGHAMGTIPLGLDCGTAELASSAVQRALFVACFASNDVRVVNLQAHQVEERIRVPNAPSFLGQPGGLVGAVLSPDQRTLYVVTDTFRVAVVDTSEHTIRSWVELGHGRYSGQVLHNGSIAISPDGTELILTDNGGDWNAGIPTNVHIFDTGTWREVRRFQTRGAVLPSSLSTSLDGRFLYGVGSSGHITSGRHFPDADTISVVDLAGDGSPAAIAFNGENITGVFVGP